MFIYVIYVPDSSPFHYALVQYSFKSGIEKPLQTKPHGNSKSHSSISSANTHGDPWYRLLGECKKQADNTNTAFLRDVRVAPEPWCIMTTNRQLNDSVAIPLNSAHLQSIYMSTITLCQLHTNICYWKTSGTVNILHSLAQYYFTKRRRQKRTRFLVVP